MRRRSPARHADSVRAFLAIRVPLQPSARSTSDAAAAGHLRRDLLTRLLDEFASLGSAVRAVSTDGVHLTLKFFGDLNANQIQSVCDVTAPVAAKAAPFIFQMHGLGVFPNERRPSVIWAGLVNVEACVALVEELELALSDAGFPIETRPFEPHVTLARVKARPPDRLAELLSGFANEDFGSFRVDGIELIASELTPRGPVYSTLAEFPLGSRMTHL
ncbi:RNA 2',3'-cyclic phosphodiesterase [bacterium]|nr:RNA 2',3'-cyclic phosphodiesterase [bacterium]